MCGISVIITLYVKDRKGKYMKSLKMYKINQAELNEILEQHRKWLEDSNKGKRADLSYTDLTGADLSHTNLTGVDLSNTDLSGANLSEAILIGADLSEVILINTLSNTDLSRTILTGANLSNTDLSRTKLSGANLTGAKLSGAILTDAILYRTDLTGAKLSGAILSGAIMDNIKGKNILIFSSCKDFAYYCDSNISIGCITKTAEEWAEEYKEIGEKHGYKKAEIEEYGKFIQLCKMYEEIK